MTSRDPRDEVRALGEELSPTPEEVEALLAGSLERDGAAPELYPLLRELPAPRSEDVRLVVDGVVARLEQGPPRPRWHAIAGVGVAIAVAAGAAAAGWVLVH